MDTLFKYREAVSTFTTSLTPAHSSVKWIDTILKNYLKKNPEDQGEIEHILDFFISGEAPKRCYKMSYEEAKRGAEQWVEKMHKKAEGITESEEDTKDVLRFDDGYRITQLIGDNAFKREGSLMSHCVASYSDRKDYQVFSLRDPNNKPHCTIGVRGDIESGQIEQIQGKGNGSIHPKYVKYVLAFIQKIGIELRDCTMDNLGYIPLSNCEWELLDNFSGVQYVKINEKKYFYKESKLNYDPNMDFSQFL